MTKHIYTPFLVQTDLMGDRHAINITGNIMPIVIVQLTVFVMLVNAPRSILIDSATFHTWLIAF